MKLSTLFLKPIKACFHLLHPGSPLGNSRLVARITTKGFRRKILFAVGLVRIQKPITRLFGPEYPITHKEIEIDITYHCNLKCLYCNRFLDFAPSQLQMSVAQIQKFIKESIEADRKWQRIAISGGEPTTHPQFLEIANLILAYKKGFSPNAEIVVMTNGYGQDIQAALSQLPSGINICNSEKLQHPQIHYPTTVAAQEVKEYRNSDFSNACFITLECGIGLNLYGYYPCTVAAAMDRILGFDIGRKKLPTTEDMMFDLLETFCSRCGHFLRYISSCKKARTPLWDKAIADFTKNPPVLTPY